MIPPKRYSTSARYYRNKIRLQIMPIDPWIQFCTITCHQRKRLVTRSYKILHMTRRLCCCWHIYLNHFEFLSIATTVLPTCLPLWILLIQILRLRNYDKLYNHILNLQACSVFHTSHGGINWLNHQGVFVLIKTWPLVNRPCLCCVGCNNRLVVFDCP